MFLGGIGLVGRGDDTPLIYSTELAALFVDAGDAVAVAEADIDEPTTLGDLNFALADSNRVARRRFKKVLPGVINVRTDGKQIFSASRIPQGYLWESYLFQRQG